MGVPAPVEELYETYTILYEASREEAVVGEGGGAGLSTVHIEYVLLFFTDVHDVGHGNLHAVGEFVLGNSGEGFGVAMLFVLGMIEICDGIEGLASDGAAYAVGVGYVEYGVACGAALDTLVHAGEEATTPDAFACGGGLVTGHKHNEAREVFIFEAEAISHPGTHGGATEARRTAIEQKLRGGVVELVGVHGIDDSHLISLLTEVGQEFGDPGAALSVLAEFVGGAEDFGVAFDESEAFFQ